MLTCHLENFSQSLEELKPLLPIHYADLALNKEKVPLSPQYDIYLERDNQGMIMFITLRKYGEMIGYFIGFVAPGLHYSTCLTLIMDIFYIHPDHRGDGGGWQLFKFVEEQAKLRGIQRMFVGSKLHKDASWLFEKLGYEHCETTYTKWLGS